MINILIKYSKSNKYIYNMNLIYFTHFKNKTMFCIDFGELSTCDRLVTNR